MVRVSILGVYFLGEEQARPMTRCKEWLNGPRVKRLLSLRSASPLGPDLGPQAFLCFLGEASLPQPFRLLPKGTLGGLAGRALVLGFGFFEARLGPGACSFRVVRHRHPLSAMLIGKITGAL